MMAVLTLGLLALVLGVAWGDDVTVHTSAGPVVGTEHALHAVTAFLGVPFAQPPIGDLRWRAPQPVTPWTAPRSAKAFAPDCAQRPNGFAPSSSEDCLYLQVWTPAVQPAEPLPVMIWYYGGAFVNGSTSYAMYDGARLAAEKNVVVVSVNYRVGVFGFLGHEVLRSRNADSSVGNYGLQDQLFGLQWVHDNIAAFGGDPAQVTIWGESAGAASVALLLLQPSAKGAFSRAIMQSGGASFWARHKLNMASLDFFTMAKNMGCTGSATEKLDCMLAASTDELLGNTTGIIQWAPVIDGVFLPEDPIEMARKGDIASQVPTLLGSNKDEGTAFAAAIFPRELPLWLYEGALTVLFKLRNLLELNVLYPVPLYKSVWWAMADVLGDWARWMSATNQTTFQYYFSRNNTNSTEYRDPAIPGPTCIGTCHGMEIPYVFLFQKDFGLLRDRLLAEVVSSYWTDFVKGKEDNLWSPFTSEKGEYMELGGPLLPMEKHELRKLRCDFFDRIEELQGMPTEPLAAVQEAAQQAILAAGALSPSHA
ncbi:uncharacterized protein MONBRDRAFT_31457 [Monosiga brevicollis MX1]|uniref:Carboxylic ester hydrolase n=1 Tax=Monosiga brevicollis TaxID=81824 RepID=A9UTA2_MONBE|nr:uncharacterized protein MONBRDRAFT_31457 [Monosiga brevicollis MX1]EDQ91458.1 predicted protein [Monosiga brevicollis MX1]|eukprot:XP_001743880.1 hypothetical protein [Monosiga brevicollis MX1]